MSKKDVRLWVQLYHDLLDAPAWRAMETSTRLLYVALRRRFNAKKNNNGKIFISDRQAAQEIGMSKNTAVRAFAELVHCGFIVMVTPGHLGSDVKGKAPGWRLTELHTAEEKATMDYLIWDGTPFTAKKAARPKKQNPVPTIGTPCTNRWDIQQPECPNHWDIEPVPTIGTYLEGALQSSPSTEEGLEVEVRAEPEAEPPASEPEKVEVEPKAEGDGQPPRPKRAPQTIRTPTSMRRDARMARYAEQLRRERRVSN